MMYDLIIVGGGPAGLAAALSARQRELNYLVVERGVIAATIYNYPIARYLFSTAEEVELEPNALGRAAKPTREEVLAHYSGLVIRERLNLHTGEEALEIRPTGEGFLITTNVSEYKTRTALVAVGGFGRQRHLNVPGETPSRVSYRFAEAHPYALRPVLVVGGGNSAAEAALFLSDAGARVTLSLRRDSLEGEHNQSGKAAESRSAGAKIKPWVREPLERASLEGRVSILTSSNVIEIRPRSALIRVSNSGGDRMAEVECDHIFALIGADPDVRLLEGAGAEIASDGRPVYAPDTYETTVGGLYVAGHLTREMHMKNAIETGRIVAGHIASHALQNALV